MELFVCLLNFDSAECLTVIKLCFFVIVLLYFLFGCFVDSLCWVLL